MNEIAPVPNQLDLLYQSAGRSAIAFVDGLSDDPNFLRHQIFESIKAQLSPKILHADVSREETATKGSLRVSLFPNVEGEILLMFDLADRNHFRQFSSDGKPYVANFRKVLVPGNWLRRRIVNDRSLQLHEENVLPLGSPRIDYLRARAAGRPKREPNAPLRVLFAPLHDSWIGRDGRPMSVASEMEPYLDLLCTRAELTIVTDGRNKVDKQPITEELLDADIIITDYTSLIYEAWSLNKPVIFPHWLCGTRILEKAPDCAEAQIYRERIGHHADNVDALIGLLSKGRNLDLGDGVDAFMSDYLANWRDEACATTIARVIERLADPAHEARERLTRTELETALKAKNWDAAVVAALNLLPWRPHDAGLYDQLALAYNGSQKWWLEVSALERAISIRPNDATLHYRLGVAAQRMMRHTRAAVAYAEAIRLAPKKATADWYYRLGYVSETPDSDGTRDMRRATAAYEAACAKDEKAKRFGVGVLHEKAGRWHEAGIAYEKRLQDSRFEPELHYRVGMCYDRTYEWAKAEASYLAALALEPANVNRHFRLGFVLERQEKYAEAATAYLHAANRSRTHKPEWFYRAGYVLEKCGRFAEACDAYARVDAKYVIPPAVDAYAERLRRERIRLLRSQLDSQPNDSALWMEYSKVQEEAGDTFEAEMAAKQAMIRSHELSAEYGQRLASLQARRRERRLLEARLNHDCTKVKDWLRYSEVLESAGELELAIDAMRQVVLRTNDHVSRFHHRLGLLLRRSGREKEACIAFRMQQILQRPHGTYQDKFEKDASIRDQAVYREFFDVLSLEPQTVLYESFGGEGCSDNPRALFEQICKDSRFTGWRHFWVVSDMSKAPPQIHKRRDTFFVLKDSFLYKYLLCTVSFLINNATFPHYYVRKSGQEYLNTWHGTPLKTLGYDIIETPIQRANTARNLIQASLFIAPNRHTEHVMLDRYGVRNLFTGRSVLTGYPRIDLLVNAEADEKRLIFNQLGLDPKKPVVLFAPTYRGHWAEPKIEAQMLADVLDKIQSTEFNLVFRGHYFAERFIDTTNLPVTIAPHSIDTCSLLAIVDVLITDYSSIFYDFLVTKRPVIHFMPDWDYYRNARAFTSERKNYPASYVKMSNSC